MSFQPNKKGRALKLQSIYIYSGFNNYHNRLNITDSPPSDLLIHSQTGVNFNPNDGVSTQVDVGKSTNKYSGKGDYMIVIDQDTGEESRWFILENQRLMTNQYRCFLRRDVLCDYHE